MFTLDGILQINKKIKAATHVASGNRDIEAIVNSIDITDLLIIGGTTLVVKGVSNLTNDLVRNGYNLMYDLIDRYKDG